MKKKIFLLLSMAVFAAITFVACNKDDDGKYTITVLSADDTMGKAYGGGEFDAGTVTRIWGTTEMGYQFCFDEFERVVGFKYLRAVHLNDSKKGAGSHVDRHEVLGEGMMGKEFFARLMHDPRFDDMPIILETPDPMRWADEIKWLRSL
jgi:hypothetical protein